VFLCGPGNFVSRPPCFPIGVSTDRHRTVARFIGIVNLYHKSIPHFADVASPLNTMRKKVLHLCGTKTKIN
jgi:hypothetical protein